MLKRRRRGEAGSAPAGASRCAMCGLDEVVLDQRGRCPLGHQVGDPSRVETAAALWPAAYEPEAGAMFTLPEQDPTQVLTPVLSVDDAAPQPPPAPAEPPVWNGEVAAPSAQSALDELLTWNETHPGASALDVETAELPPLPPPDAPVFEPVLEPITAPEDDESDAMHARKRAAGLLGGGLFVMAALAGSVAMLPL